MEIKKVILQTSALKDLTAFYKELMLLPTEHKDGNTINIRVGQSTLVFKQAVGADPFYHFAINIPANKIEEAKAWLLDRVELIWMEDYKSDIADFVNWHAMSVYFYDPAGNIVELIARFDLNNKTSEAFSSTQFLSVSEMGLVFKGDELNNSTDNLLHQYQLSYFDKQPPMPHFKAVGDDEGLFIVVPENRNWYPTTKPCGIFPMEVQFENAGKVYEVNL
jgi:hypothetical protein